MDRPIRPVSVASLRRQHRRKWRRPHPVQVPPVRPIQDGLDELKAPSTPVARPRRPECPGAPARPRRPQPAQLFQQGDQRSLDFSDVMVDPRNYQDDDDEPPFEGCNVNDPSVIGECSICNEDLSLNQAANMMCGHTFHAECVNTWRRISGNRSCPLCRTRMRQIRQIAVQVQNAMQDIIDLTNE